MEMIRLSRRFNFLMIIIIEIYFQRVLTLFQSVEDKHGQSCACFDSFHKGFITVSLDELVASFGLKRKK